MYMEMYKPDDFLLVCFRVLPCHFSIRELHMICHFVSARPLFFCRDCDWLQQLHTTQHRVRPVFYFPRIHGACVRCGTTQTCTWGDSTKTCCSSLTTWHCNVACETQERQFHSLVSFFPRAFSATVHLAVAKLHVDPNMCVAAPIHNGFLRAEFCQSTSLLQRGMCVCLLQSPVVFLSFFLFTEVCQDIFLWQWLRFTVFSFSVVPSEGPDVETTCTHSENNGRWEKAMLPEPGFWTHTPSIQRPASSPSSPYPSLIKSTKPTNTSTITKLLPV